MSETSARLRYLATSPTKVRPVLALIAGQDVAEARDTLRLCERSIARDVGKLLDSAVANAEHNDHVAEDELFVSRAFADEGPTLKRWRPRARGRGVRIRKRTSHITIVVSRFEGTALEARRRAGAELPARARPTRRAAPAGTVDHDHDQDHAHDHEHDEGGAAVKRAAPTKRAAPPKKAAPTKKTAKKSSTAKKTTKKSTKKTTASSAASPTDDAGAEAKRQRPSRARRPRKGD
jgi:large subunit ribosomal protein L22